MKKTLIVLLILVLAATAVWLWKNPQVLMTTPTTDTLSGDIMNDTGLVETGIAQEVLTGDMAIDTTGDETSSEDMLSPELQAKLDAQASIALSGEDITEEDIRLIEEILDQVRNSVE